METKEQTKVLGITEGTWKVKGDMQEGRDQSFNIQIYDNPRSSFIWVAQAMFANIIDGPIKEVKANARLIANAGNTYQKEPILPSELLKQRDELLEALQKTLPLLKEFLGEIGHDPSVGLDNSDLVYAIEETEKAINLIKP